MKNRSGCSDTVSFGYNVGPSGRFSTHQFFGICAPTSASALTGKTLATFGKDSNCFFNWSRERKVSVLFAQTACQDVRSAMYVPV